MGNNRQKGRKTKSKRNSNRIKIESKCLNEDAAQEKKSQSKKHVELFKKIEDDLEDSDLSDTSTSSDNSQKNVNWINRERILMLATRNISFIHRHLMIDIKRLLPHCKGGNKMERRNNLHEINEICSLKNCNKCILFDGQLKKDLYLWIGDTLGPTVKFLVESIYTTKQLKLDGNCLKGSRAILSFDETFIEYPHYQLLKEVLTQVFSVPNNHPKSQPCVDHVITFSILNRRIWFRNYQILPDNSDIVEIGPRFVLNPVKILEGSFCGRILWENPKFISPTTLRRLLSEMKREKQKNRAEENMAELPSSVTPSTSKMTEYDNATSSTAATGSANKSNKRKFNRSNDGTYPAITASSAEVTKKKQKKN